jgi:FkbM family methyltransferase
VEKGWTVVQVGAPADLVEVGRSRAMHFTLRVGRSGKVIAIEPDERSCAELESMAHYLAIGNLAVVRKGAWSKQGTLTLLIDDNHPATNLVEEFYDQKRNDLQKYRKQTIPVDTIAAIVSDCGASKVDLLSITTNGSEREILKGLGELAQDIKYISTIMPPEGLPILEDLGFEMFCEDDRGYLYKNISAAD